MHRALLILLCLFAAFVLVFVISRPNLDVMAVIVVVFLLFVLSLSLSLPPPPPLHLIILSIFLNNHNYLQDFLFLSILRIMLLYHYRRRHRLHLLLLLLRILSLFRSLLIIPRRFATFPQTESYRRHWQYFDRLWLIRRSSSRPIKSMAVSSTKIP